MSCSPRPVVRFLVVALLATSAAACGDDPTPPAKAPAGGASYDYDGGLHGAERRAGPKPSVVLICLGGLRADSVTEGFAKFTRENTSFVDATSPAAWSVPSVTSLLTGLLPTNHQVIPRADVHEGKRSLNQAVPTLAEILKAQGYATAAFTEGTPIDDGWGLGQGFDEYHPRFRPWESERALEEWLGGANRPYFLFVHVGEDEEVVAGPSPTARIRAVVDPLAGMRQQDPGEPPPPGAGADLLTVRYEEPEVYAVAVERLGERYVLDAIHHWLDAEAPTDAKRDAVFVRIREAYKEHVRHLRNAMTRLLDDLAKQVPSSDTIIVVCSDHGEALGEHGFAGHGRTLYDEQIRVPLVVKATGRLAQGEVRGSVSLLDVMPTILDLVGLPPPPDGDGRSLLDKAGLTPDRVVAAQEGRLSRGPGGEAAFDLLALRTSRAKYVVTLDARTLKATEEVFDLTADPGEAKPLPATDLARFGAELVTDVERVREQIRDGVQNAEVLKGLGYGARRVIPTLKKSR